MIRPAEASTASPFHAAHPEDPQYRPWGDSVLSKSNRQAAVAKPAAPADTYSTSSSTLVNNDIEESGRKQQDRGDITRLKRFRAQNITDTTGTVGASAAHLPNRRTAQFSRMSAPTRRSRPHSSKAPTTFPDDHRCSDFEADGGVCPCVLVESSSSSSSSSSGGERGGTGGRQRRRDSERRLFDMDVQLSDKGPRAIQSQAMNQNIVQPIAQSTSRIETGNGDGEYTRRLMLARRRKVLNDNASFIATPKDAGGFPASTPPHFGYSQNVESGSTRGLFNAEQAATPKEQSNNIHGQDDAISPSKRSLAHRQPRSRLPVFSALGGTNNVSDEVRTTPRINDTQNGSSASSAARKSISNVFERLLREEEERREAERLKKDVARQRRREEKLRRDDGNSSVAYTSHAESTSHASSQQAGSLSPERVRMIGLPEVQVMEAPLSPSLETRAALGSLSLSQTQARSNRASDIEHNGAGPAMDVASLSENVLLSPRTADYRMRSAPSSPDSVSRFQFPSRSPSPSEAEASPSRRGSQDKTSPRRTRHQRSNNKAGSSPVVSVSARFPAMDTTEAEARIKTSLQPSALEVMGEGYTKPEIDPLLQQQHLTPGSGRRVSFSPVPDVIRLAQDSQEEPQQATTDELPGSPGTLRGDVGTTSHHAEPHTPVATVKSAMKGARSPWFPGTYFSPAGPSATLTSTSSSASKQGARDDPSQQHFPLSSASQGSSRGRRSSLAKENDPSRSDTSETETPAILQDHSSDPVRIGHDSWRQPGPRESTPPPTSPASSFGQTKASNASIEIGDDSLRGTVQDLMSALGRSKDVLAFRSEENDTSFSDGVRIGVNTKPRLSDQKQLAIADPWDGDEEYQARLATVRSRLVALASELNLDTCMPAPLRTKASFPTWKAILVALFAQITLIWLMLAAAHVRAEQLYLTLHHDAWHGFADPSLPSTTITTLTGSLLLHAGLLPDHYGAMSILRPTRFGSVAATLMSKSWPSIARLALAEVQRPGHRAAAVRLLIARSVAALGIDEGDIIGIGHRVPT